MRCFPCTHFSVVKDAVSWRRAKRLIINCVNTCMSIAFKSCMKQCAENENSTSDWIFALFRCSANSKVNTAVMWSRFFGTDPLLFEHFFSFRLNSGNKRNWWKMAKQLIAITERRKKLCFLFYFLFGYNKIERKRNKNPFGKKLTARADFQ